MASQFYLHICDRGQVAEDPDGVELEDLASACALAVTGGREILSERVRVGQPIDGLSIVIRDVAGGYLA
ncbi:MAG TPA: hypothetical protein VGC51_03000 [Hansschlegelia sp.]